MSYTQFHDDVDHTQEEGAPAPPGKTEPVDGEKFEAPVDDVPPAYSTLPIHQQQQSQGVPLQQVVAVVPQNAEPGVIYTPTRRMRAQPRHVAFVVLSYVAWCMFDQSILAPIPLVGFICALVSLWKQERGDPKTSNILGFVAIGISVFAIIGWIVLLAVDLAMIYPQYWRFNHTKTRTTEG